MEKIYLNKINDYIKAKDGNKVHLMRSVFAVDAVLEMHVNSNNITFPAKVVGLDEISEVLVRSFNQSYENIYTLCLENTISIQGRQLNCSWLVGMTDRSSKNIRFGYGQYTWVFSNNFKVDQLAIRIDEMTNLPAEQEQRLLSWLQVLNYPWVHSTKVLEKIPDIEELEGFKKNLLAYEVT